MSRKRRLRQLVAGAAVGAAALSASAAPATSPDGGTYRVGLETDSPGGQLFGWSDGFDPTGENNAEALGIYSNLLLRTLVGYEHVAGPAGNRLVADLAERVPHPRDSGHTYTFQLKRGIRFGPPVSREITSRDIRYAIERAARPRNGAQYAFYFQVIRGFAAYRTGKTGSISGIETPDARTIRFTLAEPNGAFLYRLALPAAAPMPQEIARCFEGRPGAYGSDVVSSGPYMIEGSASVKLGSCNGIAPMSGSSDTRLVLVRNPRYDPKTDTRAARESNPDRFVFAYLSGNVTPIVAQLSAGELEDAYLEPSFAQVLRHHAAKAAGLGRLRVNPEGKMIFVALNLTRPPFDDVHVRRALNWIADKARYREEYGGAKAGSIAQHLVPDDVLGNRLDGFAPFATSGDHGNLARAKAEMAKSKYATKNGVCTAKACKRIHLKTDGPYGPGQRIAPLFKADAAKIGITFINRGAKIDEPASNNAIVVNIDWLKEYPDPSDFLDFFAGREIVAHGNYNYSLVGITPAQARALGVDGRVGHAPSVDADIARCQRLSEAPRLDCYAALDRKLTTDVVPWIPLMSRNHINILGPQVERWVFDQSTGTTAYAHVAVKS